MTKLLVQSDQVVWATEAAARLQFDDNVVILPAANESVHPADQIRSFN